MKTPSKPIKNTILSFFKVTERTETINTSVKDKYAIGEVVQARVSGHPWWPCIVVPRHEGQPHRRLHKPARKPSKKQRRSGGLAQVYAYNLQFFDDPVCRAWVLERDMKPMEKTPPILYSAKDAKLAAAYKQCEEIAKLEPHERITLFADYSLESDNEVIEEDDDVVDLDTSVGVMSVDDSESDKENDTGRLKRRCASKKANKEKRRRIALALESDQSGSDDKDDSFVPGKVNDSESDGSEDSGNPSEEMSTAEEEDLSAIISSGDDVDKPVTKRTDNSTPSRGTANKKPRTVAARNRIMRMASSSSDEDEAMSTIDLEPQSSSKKSTVVQEDNKITIEDKKITIEDMITPTKSKIANIFTTPLSSKTKSKFASFQSVDTPTTPRPKIDEQKKFPHMSYDFLKEDQIRDHRKRLRSSPEYDFRSIYVPEAFLSKQTPAHRQWWVIKSKHFDTILFFKMGKFYELFHIDAVTIVKECGIIFMKGEYAHAGFPEVSYGRYAGALMSKGYKVARIEQMETPDQCAERCKHLGRQATKFDRVVNREVCSVQTDATRRHNFLDRYDNSTNAASLSGNDSMPATHLMALCERPALDSNEGGSEYGVCFVDASVGQFWLGQFTDDRYSSRLRTLLCRYPISQIIYEKKELSKRTQQILDNNSTIRIHETVRAPKQFLSASDTLETLRCATYFRGNDGKQQEVDWPPALFAMIDPNDTLEKTALPAHKMAVSSLGAVVWYLRACSLDIELLSLCRFKRYVPVDIALTDATAAAADLKDEFPLRDQHMVLDATTLQNLDVILNEGTQTLEGTLLSTMDLCVTKFGHQLFRQRLCAPLCHPSAIEERQDAITELISLLSDSSQSAVLMKSIGDLETLPDLDRILSRIHTLGLAQRESSHPDSRAIFFDSVIYNKRKIIDFINALSGFQTIYDIIKNFKSIEFQSTLLKNLLVDENSEGKFTDLKNILKTFDKAFDKEKAKSSGTIIPCEGVDPEYDSCMEEIHSFRNDLEDYLGKQKKLLKCQSIVYWGTGKNRYQLEVPESALSRIPNDYNVTSQRKGFRRYRTADIENILEDLSAIEDKRDIALKDSMRRCFALFDRHYSLLLKCLHCIAEFDTLYSLACYARRLPSDQCCRPVFVPVCDDINNNLPILELRDAKHPCIVHTFNGNDFISNDTVIGCDKDDKGQLVLVTGPNMGGKSTLMRQVALLVIMAQMGSYVPAKLCRLSPVDRIFTRLGAGDNIMQGESTFFMELSETSAILCHATKHSLVLLDELGRGTATYDGTAIAGAVVNELSTRTFCRTLFSTHYHSLVDEFKDNDNVRLGHMACMLENDDEQEQSSVEMITFLYKFIAGPCPKSYGFNVARLANIPDQIIRKARDKALQLENTVKLTNQFRSIMNV